MEKYHIFHAGDNARLAELHCPVDASGNPFPEYQAIDSLAYAKCFCVDKRIRLADCVYCITNLFVSPRAADVFKRFLVPEGTVFLPVEVYARNGNLVGNMVSVMFSQIVTAVDLPASQFKELSAGIPWYFTAPPVLSMEELRGLDLVRSFHVKYVCSDRLRREIIKEELTNFAFEPVVVH